MSAVLDSGMAIVTAATAYECPLCYFKEREMKAEPGKTWPKRMRWLADVQRKCRGCGKMTFHCSAGTWEPGEKFDLKNEDL